jgi:hypothetical protein
MSKVELIHGEERKQYLTVQSGKQQIREHRYVMENFLGRKLFPSELIHHKNGNKFDNRIENLEIVTRAQHIKIHEIGESGRFKQKHFLTTQEITSLYNTMTIAGIALKLNVSTGTVIRFMKINNIKRRNRGARIYG